MDYTPKEKAKELIMKCVEKVADFSDIGAGYSDIEMGKPLAIIIVDEVENVGCYGIYITNVK